MIRPRIKPSGFSPGEASDDMLLLRQRKAKLEGYVQTLAAMDESIDFSSMATAVDVVACPRADRGKGGRPPHPTEVLVRMVFLQGLSALKFICLVTTLLILSTGCSSTDFTKRIPNEFMLNQKIIKKDRSTNCESAVLKISKETTEKFLESKNSSDFLTTQQGDIYAPWSSTPVKNAKLESMAIIGECTRIFGGEYLKILSSSNAFHTNHRQKFLLFDTDQGNLYYVFQGN